MPRGGNSIQDQSLLVAALEGLQLQKQRIEQQIQEVRALLGKAPGRPGRPAGSTTRAVAASTAVPKKRVRLSTAARKRIAAAQKRRWAAYRKSAGGKSE